MMILLMSQATMLEAKPNPRVAGGKFDYADFFAPDYNNGETETFDVGENKSFNYNCHCANQPSQKPCNGYIRLQVDTGSGFVNEKSDACNINEGQTCSASHTKTFNTAGVYTFRVFCDENSGTDFVQPSSEHVVLTVEDTSCVENETQPCPLQQGICEGAAQTCVNGSWTECDYGSNYEEVESTCDDLDNDCDGLTDEVDNDGDFSSPCGGMGVVNEFLLSGLNNDDGNITIFSYNLGTEKYRITWTNDSTDINAGWSGGEIGDVTHDGVNDFVLGRQTTGGGTGYLEVWSYNPSSQEWYRVARETVGSGSYRFSIGDIADFDNDTLNEILVGNGFTGDIEIWGNDTVNATGFSLNATVKDCGDPTFIYNPTGGDMNNNDIPEIVFKCFLGSDIYVYEWNGTGYGLNTTLVAPLDKDGDNPMIWDDAECGDVNRDTVDDCVFCGNSGRSHVLTYSGGSYSIAYNSSVTPGNDNFTQTCSVGDITNDGWGDWFDVSGFGIRVFSYNGTDYVNVWNSSYLGDPDPPVGAGFLGDSDNDGKNEFLFRDPNSDKIILYENDSEDARSFNNTFNWSDSEISSNVIIGNLNPYNDDMGVDCNDNDASIHPGAVDVCGDGVDQDCDGEDNACNCIDNDNDTYYGYDKVYCPTGNDCNDNNASINPGAEEICGDGVDNDCNNEIDEGCEVCGNDYCAGSAAGEDCFTCPDDCLCAGPSCSKACCGDGTCNGPWENADKCPVDCS